MSTAYSFPSYVFEPPFRNFGTYWFSFALAWWWWSAFGMLMSVFFKDATTQILVCLMHSVIIDPILSGMAPQLWTLRETAYFTELRWRRQALIASELIGYPIHVHSLVEPLLNAYFMDPNHLTEEMYEAWFHLIADGGLMRLLTLLLLVLAKYSEGGSLVWQFYSVLKNHLCTSCWQRVAQKRKRMTPQGGRLQTENPGNPFLPDRNFEMSAPDHAVRRNSGTVTPEVSPHGQHRASQSWQHRPSQS